MVKRCKNRKAVTLVELVILTLLVGVVGATFAGGVIFFVQLFVYSPHQLDVQKISQGLTFEIVEGNQDARGIRYARSVIDATAIQLSYTYGYPTSDDQLSVRFRWDPVTKHIYKSTSTDGGSIWSAEAVTPYHMPTSITIDGKDTPSVIFTYKKDSDVDWTVGVDALTDIRRAIFSVNLKTGTGEFVNFQGATEITSSIEIKNFQ